MISVDPLDLSLPSGAQAWISAAIAQWGRIDVLYNNAAVIKFAAIIDRRQREQAPGVGEWRAAFLTDAASKSVRNAIGMANSNPFAMLNQGAPLLASPTSQSL
jgi:NAD(P)-dependent dehydrogenase (short-subunit alcohol dehydrogenase family)